MNDDAYKKMAGKCPLVVPVHSGTHLRNMVLDTKQGEAYLVAESDADYQKLQGQIKQELVANGFEESEAGKYVANLKPMIGRQQPIPGDLELEILDTSGSIPTPRTPGQQEQTREACYQLYSKMFGVDVDKVRAYFDVVRDVLNEGRK
jgi:hypothetical protein